MNLIRLGSAVLNMDPVTNLVLEEDAISVFFVEGLRGSGVDEGEVTATGNPLRFHGEEAVALQRWIGAHTTDITPPPDFGSRISARTLMRVTTEYRRRKIAHLRYGVPRTSQVYLSTLFHPPHSPQ